MIDPPPEYVKDIDKDYPNSAIDVVKRNVAHAVKETYGHDRIIMEVRDQGTLGTGLFPQGVREFQVTSESSECTHTPKCSWIDLVYHYHDRSVVVRVEDFHRISV